MIEATDISFGFGTEAGSLFDGVCWTDKPGQVEALLGPNGSGKTTLLRLLSGDLSPTSGHVHLAGRELRQWPADELARYRAFLSQSPRLDFAFSVREVVLMGRSPFALREDTTADHAIVDRLIEELDLRALAHRPFPALSRGEKQRVQLARVLAQLEGEGDDTPRLLFLDEPTNHLDLAHQHLTLELARRRALRGHSVVVVLHDLNLALRYADSATVLSGGKIVDRGAPAQVLSTRCLAEVFAVSGALVERPGHRPHLVVDGPVKSAQR